MNGERLPSRPPLLIAESQAMKRVLQTLERIARWPRSTVLLLGEPGVGKEVLARHLHSLTFGKDAPFVHVNCPALSEHLSESELFRTADGGTLFLDHVSELPLPVQIRMLPFLDSGHFRRPGASREEVSVVRVVSATSRNLDGEIRAGRFREDLWFRLNVIPVRVPNLIERHEDILPLADSVVRELCEEMGRAVVQLTEDARQRLLQLPFRGNIRELRNLLERALVAGTGASLDLDAIETETVFRVPGPPITLEELGRRYAQHMLVFSDYSRLTVHLSRLPSASAEARADLRHKLTSLLSEIDGLDAATR